jgi:hypothetical protein
MRASLALVFGAVLIASCAYGTSAAAAVNFDVEEEADFQGEDEFDDFQDGAVGDNSVDFEDVDSFDEETGDGIEPSMPAAIQAPTKRSYVYEALGGIGVVLYIVLYFVGSAKNKSIASAWLGTYDELLTTHFANVGTNASWKKFMAETGSDFKLFATGRRYCKGLLAELNLVKRQDLLSFAYHLIQPTKDTLTIDIPMREGVMQPFVLAVIRSKDRKTVHKETPDLTDFATPLKVSDLPSGLEVLTDSREAAEKLLTKPVKKALESCKSHFKMLHFTDRAPMSAFGTSHLSHTVLRLQLHLPAADRMESVRPLMDMMMYFIDAVGETRISAAGLKKGGELRKAYAARLQREAAAERQEEAAARKAEKLKAEREALKKLSASAREKKEAKMERRERKKRMPGMKMRTKMM